MTDEYKYVDAAFKVLREAGRPLSKDVLVERIIMAGPRDDTFNDFFSHAQPRKMTTFAVASEVMLYMVRTREDPDIVLVDGDYALAEWATA